MLLKNNREEEYSILLKAVKNEVFHFIVVQYNHYGLIRETQSLVQQTYPNKKTQKINLLEEPAETLTALLLEDNSDIFFIENFQVLFQDENQSVAIGINQRRDKLSQKKGQIIAFLPSGNVLLRNFQKKMPDLSSITNIIIQLEEEQPRSTDLQNNPSLFMQNNDYDNIPDAETEIRRIEKRLSTLKEEPENSNLRIQLIFNLAKAYKFTGQYAKARKQLEDLKKYAESIDSSEEIISSICNDLALVLQNLGDYQQAKIYLEKALNSSIKNFGEEHPTTAIRYSNLATVLKDLRDYPQAKVYLEKSLNSHIKNFGEEHPTTATCYSNLATVLQDLGEYTQAKIYLEKALNSNIKNFGKEHPTTAICYSNLAMVLQDLGEYPQAKIYLEKALDSNIKNFGEEHPTTVMCYSNLATVLQNLGEYPQAKIYLEKALNSSIKKFGEKHPNNAIYYSNLATVLQSLGDYQQSKTYFEKALNSSIKNFGEEHPSTAIRYSNLALVLQILGEYHQAKTYIEKALLSDIKNLGEEHPATARSYSNLAVVLQSLGEYTQAKIYLEKALAVFVKNLGEEHPHTKIAKGNLDFLNNVISKNKNDHPRP